MAETRPSLAQHVVWRLEALAYDLVTGLARLFPIDAVSDFGAWLFQRLGPLTSTHKVVQTNLRIAFPQADEAEIARLTHESWAEAGRVALEFPILDKIVGDPTRVEVVNAERLRQIADTGESVVFISGHFSSMEVMPAAIVHAGITCQITYRAMNNPHVDESFRRSRFRYGVRLFAPKGTESARELIRALGRGECVALMNDQKFNGGVAAPLFGVTCYTAPGPSSFALRFGIPLQPMSVQRTHKARFKVVVHDPIHLANTGHRNEDIAAGVAQVNAFIEDRIRDRPTEWFWVHKRWPNEVYKRSRK
ncbi:MAG: lysophospholipid acyltransferase family protein [Phenylobacterium sp.]|uniref:lysophospholipid acyltransferase family protein n=1 Tax=Phenylobacterium sp. TaxID=1871053 RepID=UPI00271A4AF4|nr:lysophospholipid acyltransferase family protein [Phenylobacterium sp.]MDO8913411.1 lysophospholipid acyltransferase family protein [Phenylobacterium sp.]MDO9246097.1 lysophospholipid acyltransferase family protein [Phenylobacterium sp.]MDP3101257.1 lysophospholipid acyltransferase family protein [Phenylobacterium sp.]MDP3633454.1 lysophospholipid acyltransferase family protein [Phenylobacterium sp.]MDP3867772.1 lysophospholipid acyltransferase family protein [Phenylobacterium sp.]